MAHISLTNGIMVSNTKTAQMTRLIIGTMKCSFRRGNRPAKCSHRFMALITFMIERSTLGGLDGWLIDFVLVYSLDSIVVIGSVMRHAHKGFVTPLSVLFYIKPSM